MRYAVRLLRRTTKTPETYKTHPFLVKHILALDVGRGVSANWVSEVFSTMGVQLAARVAVWL